MAAYTLEIIDHLAVLTLVSREKRNLLTPASAVEIASAVEGLLDNPAVKALAVTGQAGAFVPVLIYRRYSRLRRAMVKNCSRFIRLLLLWHIARC